MTRRPPTTEIARIAARVVVSVLVAFGVGLWVGISLFAYVGSTEEGGRPGVSPLRIVIGVAFPLLVVASVTLALRLVWKANASRPLCAAVLVAGLAQLGVLVSALSLSHFVRSGLAWETSAWRRFVSDLCLAELFAYYPWLGAIALVVAAAVTGVAAVRLFSKGTEVTLTGCCGIDCAECPTFVATQSGDSSELARLAAVRREHFGRPEISAESMPCDGCTSGGRLSWTCLVCPIRACASEHGLETCAPCEDLDTCDKLRPVHDHMPQAKAALGRLRPLGP